MSQTPIVFLHGIRLSGPMWQRQRERFGSERAVATPDLPGHGDRAAQTFTLDAAVCTVNEAIERVGGPALLVGLSMGGYVAMATAHRHPSAVAGLMLLGCTLRTQGAPVPPQALFDVIGRPWGDACQRAMLRLALGRAPADTLLSGGLYTRAVPDVLAALTGFDAPAALADYPGRTWLINGSFDHFRLDEKHFLAAAQNATLEHVRGGHLVAVSRPELLSAKISAALHELDATDGASLTGCSGRTT